MKQHKHCGEVFIRLTNLRIPNEIILRNRDVRFSTPFAQRPSRSSQSPIIAAQERFHHLLLSSYGRVIKRRAGGFLISCPSLGFRVIMRNTFGVLQNCRGSLLFCFPVHAELDYFVIVNAAQEPNPSRSEFMRDKFVHIQFNFWCVSGLRSGERVESLELYMWADANNRMSTVFTSTTKTFDVHDFITPLITWCASTNIMTK